MSASIPIRQIALSVATCLGLVFASLHAVEQPTGVIALVADESEQVPCGGAAVVITPDGLAITLNEALPRSAQTGEGPITVVVSGGLRRQATIVRRGAITTAVLLQIADVPASVKPVSAGNSAVATLGEIAWTAGNAFGAIEEDGAPALSRGIISGRYVIPADSPPVRGRGGRELSAYRGEVLEIDAALNDGNHGGAVLDNAGRLIGLGSLGTARPRKLGTVIPLHLILKDLALTIPIDNKPAPVDAQVQALVSAASKTAPGLVLVYFKRLNGPGNPASIPRPPRLVEEVPKYERERMERWWGAYYHQQQMFYTDQAVPALVIDAKEGLLLTSAHNLHGDATAGEVLLPTGAINCSVLATHLPLDLALLKTEKPLEIEAVKLSSSPQLSLGQPIAIVGRHRGDNGFTCTTGVVSTTNRRQQQTDAMFAQTDALANYGSLGGAVVDIAGDVVGMVVLLGPEGDSLPWAINSGVALFVDSATILREMTLMREGKSTTRAPIVGLGIKMAPFRPGRHPRITEVTEGTGAEAAGIKSGDILMQVDGVDTTSHLAITRALVRHRAGDVIPVVVKREGEELTFQVEIRAFNSDE